MTRIGIDARLVFYSRAGISQYIVHLTKALADLNAAHPDNVEFLLLQSRKDKSSILHNGLFSKTSLWTPCHHRLEQSALRFETARLGLDILHSPDFIPPLKRNYKSIITVHDLAFLLYPQFMTKESARYYGQIDQAVRSADHIIAVSQSTKLDLNKLLGVPGEKVTVIYEGVSPKFYAIDLLEAQAEVKRKFGLEPGYILFISTIEPRKNVPTLLKAYRYFRDHFKRTEKLVLAGSRGWLPEEVDQTLNHLNLQNDVIFLGRVPDEYVNFLYNAASMLIYPSFYEGFGLPPLEAMQCGVPVIASLINVMPEVVGDAAMLVDPHDVENLGVTINRLLEDTPLRKDLINKGFKRAAKFSWDQTARETLAVYHHVAHDQTVEVDGWRLGLKQS